MKEMCPVQIRKSSAVLKVEQNKIMVAEAREKIKDKKIRAEVGNKRAAIEGTISALKRSQGAGELMGEVS